MTWLAISDGRRPGRVPQVGADALVPRGSLVVEASFAAEAGRDQTLIQLDRTKGWHRSFRMTLRADGQLFTEHRQNREVTRVRLKLRVPESDAVMRFSYSWNGPEREGVLTAENLDTGRLDQTVFDAPQPWPIDDITALVSDKESCVLDEHVSLVAVSDKVEPVGLAAGLVGDTLVDTSLGPRRVKDLQPGDLVLTAERGLQPVRWTASREVPAGGRFAPIILAAPFFGLKRDMAVTPGHRILIEGADAEYLFGADAVLVEARDLAGMAGRPRKPTTATITYVQVILDTHACLSASGIWVESMFLSRLQDDGLCAATSGLADIPSHLLPRHTHIAGPQLKPFEAVVLVSAMCA